MLLGSQHPAEGSSRSRSWSVALPRPPESILKHADTRAHPGKPPKGYEIWCEEFSKNQALTICQETDPLAFALIAWRRAVQEAVRNQKCGLKDHFLSPLLHHMPQTWVQNRTRSAGLTLEEDEMKDRKTQMGGWEQGPERVIYPGKCWEGDWISSLMPQTGVSLRKILLFTPDQEFQTLYPTCPCCHVLQTSWKPAQGYHAMLQGWTHSWDLSKPGDVTVGRMCPFPHVAFSSFHIQPPCLLVLPQYFPCAHTPSSKGVTKCHLTQTAHACEHTLIRTYRQSFIDLRAQKAPKSFHSAIGGHYEQCQSIKDSSPGPAQVPHMKIMLPIPKRLQLKHKSRGNRWTQTARLEGSTQQKKETKKCMLC